MNCDLIVLILVVFLKPEGAARNDVVRILPNSKGGLHHFISHFSANDATYKVLPAERIFFVSEGLYHSWLHYMFISSINQ